MILGPQGPGKVGQRGGFFVAGVAQLVEHYLAKVDVASSNLVSRSTPPFASPEAEGLFCCQVNKNKNAEDRNYPLSSAFLLDFSVSAEQSDLSWSVRWWVGAPAWKGASFGQLR